jgi:16S rRNA processing protein RimM
VPNPITHLVIGRVAAPRGVRGELKVTIETEDPERFFELERVYLGDEREPFDVVGVRLYKGQALLLLDGITSRDQAEEWIGELVQVELRDALPLGEGEYYHFQIEGLDVLTDVGAELGRVTEVLSTGANDVYVVRGASGETLIPALKGVVLEIDLETRRMVVRLPDGLR